MPDQRAYGALERRRAVARCLHDATVRYSRLLDPVEAASAVIPISDQPGPRHRFPIVMVAILAANVLAFLYELTLGNQLERLFFSAGVIPVEYTQGREVGALPPGGLTWLTLFTSMFLHGGLLHIASNMLYLFVFGDNVEDAFGHVVFLAFYLVCGLAASAAHILLNAGSDVPSVGASGAIAGVLAAYLLLYPKAEIHTLILRPFITVTRVSAFVLIGFWFLLQLVSGIASLGAPTEQTGGVAVWAHVGGFLAGLVLAFVLRGAGRSAVPSGRPPTLPR